MTSAEFERLQAAFHQASVMSREERIAFVEQWRQSDSDFAEELSGLLSHDKPDNDPIESVCEAHRDVADVMLDKYCDQLPAVAGYRVSHRIGRGGQAEVFLAHQDSTGQPVALKVFLGTRLTTTQRARIDAETASLVRLQLPNVVPILDRGLTDDGRECLMTRYIDGIPLDEAASHMLNRTPERVLLLIARVAETLERVHSQGIVHRDLKPSNILVDREGEPYLLDFGLARFYADPSGRLLSATLTTGFQGSLRWASPEQIDASFGDIDNLSDVYSLGVMLYQCLTGHFPYPVDGSFLQVAEQIVRTDPAPLRRWFSTENSYFDAAVGQLMARVLAKSRRHRIQSAGQLAAELKQLANSSLSSNQSAGSQRKLNIRAILIAGCVVAVVFGFLFMNRDQPQDAVLHSDGAGPAVIQHVEGVINGPSSGVVQTPVLPVPKQAPKQQSVDLDEHLLPFGQVPDGWSQVGELRSNSHEIAKTGLSFSGNFTLRLSFTARRVEDASFVLTLVGSDHSDDVQITGTKTTTWSDNEAWLFRTPNGQVRTGLPIGSHTLILKRRGDLYTLTVDAVYRPDRNSSELATFAAGDRKSFEAIRVATSGASLRLERLRLYTE